MGWRARSGRWALGADLPAVVRQGPGRGRAQPTNFAFGPPYLLCSGLRTSCFAKPQLFPGIFYETNMNGGSRNHGTSLFSPIPPMDRACPPTVTRTSRTISTGGTARRRLQGLPAATWRSSTSNARCPRRRRHAQLARQNSPFERRNALSWDWRGSSDI